MQFKDQLNRTISISNPPKRIVSLVPSQTELLVDLGLEDRLVGITKFCIHPKGLRSRKVIVGGTKQVHIDKISGLQPDLILCNKEENTPEMVHALETIAPVWVSDVVSLADALKMIQKVGRMTEVSSAANGLCKRINSEREAFESFIKYYPKRKVLYLIWKGPYMAAGKHTFIDTLLDLNHFENVLSETESRYPEVSASEIQRADLILLSSEPYPFKKTDVESKQKEFGRKVLLVDGAFFSWYGSRLVQAFHYFRTLH